MSCYAYGLSKGALHHLSRMLARGARAARHPVNAIAPGRFATRMTRAIADDPVRYERDTTAIPLDGGGALLIA